MQPPKILTLLFAPVLAATVTLFPHTPAQAQKRTDAVLLDMQQAFRKGDKATLAALLPKVRGHALEFWGAYWELKARLEEATPQEVQAFLDRYAGTYLEDRLRNDWLLLLGKRRDWAAFAAEYPKFRMNDDREVRCYALAAELLKSGAQVAGEVRHLWYTQRDNDEGCAYAADRAHASGQLHADDVWRKARMAVESNGLTTARQAIEIAAPDATPMLTEVMGNPERYLSGRTVAGSRMRKEMAVMALLRMAASDPAAAARQLDTRWDGQLTTEQRNWVWGAIGRQAAMRLQEDASSYFGRVTRNRDLTDEMLAWKARAALRQGQWKEVLTAIDAMSKSLRDEPAWTYWKARALLNPARDEVDHGVARQLLERLAGLDGFYPLLALEELGRQITLPERPPALTDEEKATARGNPGLDRALQAIAIGLRAEGVREWNYTTNLHTSGGLKDRELLAAADLACQREVWDRCINTSERTRSFIDMVQRFPTPYRAQVVRRARQIDLNPAYVYGLIRQESRFVTDARSGVGASGLMQVMPATARWTARKLGMSGFRPDQLTDRDTNIAIGTGYLKLVLDDFGGSMPLAAAAYNAGPGRPRVWRNGPVIEAAIWAENVPFSETRDYVKKVLANTTLYAAMLTGQPQSLKAHLGTVGPREASAVAENRDLP